MVITFILLLFSYDKVYIGILAYTFMASNEREDTNVDIKSDKSKITTIKVSEKTKERIENLRIYPRETYETIMQRLLEILNICRVEPERARGRLILLEKERRRNLKVR